MLQSRIQKQIPERLSHYTNLEALKSILSDQDGKGIYVSDDDVRYIVETIKDAIIS